MKATVRFLAIGVLAIALTGVLACSSSGGTTASTTTASSAPASTAAKTGTTGTTGTMAAPTASAGSAAGLTSSLGTSLGLTSDQASGAVGSVLSLAQSKLPASDYTKVATALPGADTYVQKAKDLGAVPSDGITDTSGLNAAYSKLGISPEIGSQITPLVTNYVGKVAGPTVGGLLSSVLK
jgi:Protein of unknown function VcgC/VcgE (DUF2780)